MIKHLICILLATALVSGSSHAQEKMQVGVFVGSVTNQFVGDRVSSISEIRFKFGNSGQMGCMVDYSIKKDVSLSLHPSYKLVKGTLLEENENYDPETDDDEKFLATQDIQLSYLTLPLELKLISDNRHWQFFCGLAYGLLIEAKSRDIQTKSNSDISHYIENHNLSATVGLGYRFQIKKQLFTIDLRYAQGLMNIASGKYSKTDFPRLKSTSAETRINWILPFGNRER
jgi:hypothetical protein